MQRNLGHLAILKKAKSRKKKGLNRQLKIHSEIKQVTFVVM